MSASKVANKVHAATEKAPRQVTFAPEGRDPITAPTETDRFSPEMMAEQYPSKGYDARDARDAKYELIAELQGDTPTGATPYGQVQWNDDVVRWMEKKKQAGVKAQFEQWFAAHFDKMSPTAKALAQDLYPNFYRERLQTLKLNVKLLEQLASIRLRGVQTKSDLFLQYAADQGLIDLSGIENVLHPEKMAADQTQRFKRGVFNPRRLLNGDDGLGTPEGRTFNQQQFHYKPPQRGYANQAGDWPLGFSRGDVTSKQFMDYLKQ